MLQNVQKMASVHCRAQTNEHTFERHENAFFADGHMAAALKKLCVWILLSWINFSCVDKKIEFQQHVFNVVLLYR